MRNISRHPFLIMAGLLIAACLTICLAARGMGSLLVFLTQMQMAGLKGNPAPEFTLVDLDGNRVSLSDLQGQPVLINFWATWCPSCREEMPDFLTVYEERKDRGLMVLAISNEESAAVRGYAVENKISFPLLLDSEGAVAGMYRVRVLPTTFFVSKDGVIVHVSLGSVNREKLEELLDKIE